MRSAIAAALLFLAAPLAGQGGVQAAPGSYFRLTGTVTDAGTGRAIPGAAVRIRDLDQIARTGPDGRFDLSRVPLGPVTLVFEQPGYSPLIFAQVVEPDTPPIRVGLRPIPVVREQPVRTAHVVERHHRRHPPAPVAGVDYHALLPPCPAGRPPLPPCVPWPILYGPVEIPPALAVPQGRFSGYPIDAVRNRALQPIFPVRRPR